MLRTYNRNMKNNIVILIAIILVVVVVCYSCMGRGKENYDENENIRRQYEESQAMGSSPTDYELLDHPATDGFGVGPAGSQQMTPEWSLL